MFDSQRRSAVVPGPFAALGKIRIMPGFEATLDGRSLVDPSGTELLVFEAHVICSRDGLASLGVYGSVNVDGKRTTVEWVSRQLAPDSCVEIMYLNNDTSVLWKRRWLS